MARAASSGSYSDPSVITRATRTASWPATAACPMRGTPGSPRPCLASRAWAFAMARSPPLTATYIGLLLFGAVGDEAGGAGGRGNGGRIHQQQVNAAREQLRVPRPGVGEAVGRPGGDE